MTDEQKEVNRRKRRARRVFYKRPLMAMLEMKGLYPNYTEEMLYSDLKLKGKSRKRLKRGKKRPIVDFRTAQIEKYSNEIKSGDPDSKAYHRACQQIALLTDALNKRRFIVMTVKKATGKMEFYFRWQTTERQIKDFHTKANEPSLTMDELIVFHNELTKITTGISPR